MRATLRALLILIVLAGAAFYLFGYWAGTGRAPAGAVGTTGIINTERVRERGADLAERAVVATEKVRDTVGEASLTAKIKAKMALDDSIKARAINVTTTGSTVTLSGTVGSVAEHDRAVALARETDGIARVVDNLRVVPD